MPSSMLMFHAAAVGAVAADVALLPLSFSSNPVSVTPLATPYVLLARSEWACARFCPFGVLDRVATWVSKSGYELVDVLLCDSFTWNSCTFQMTMAGMELGPLECLVCPVSTCRLSFSKHTPITLLMVSLSHLLCGSNLLISRALSAPSAFHMERWDSFRSWDPWRSASPTPSHKTGQTLLTISCHAVSQVVFSRLGLSDTCTGCVLHVPPTTADK